MFETVHTDVLRAPVVISLMLNLLFLCNIVRVLFMKLRAPAGPQGGAPSRNILQAFRYVAQNNVLSLPLSLSIFPQTHTGHRQRPYRFHFFPRFNLHLIAHVLEHQHRLRPYSLSICFLFFPFCPIGICPYKYKPTHRKKIEKNLLFCLELIYSNCIKPKCVLI